MVTDSYGHEVPEDTPASHSHDHTHAHVRAERTHAGHVHWHLHLDDRHADTKLNGHTHPARHEQLPWEANES